MKQIPFSPPDITEAEIEAVTQALRSGWITTGPQTKRFEQRIRDYTGAAGAACLNSATAALELTLRLLGVGPGDEVITSAYTYTASASVIAHVGAKIVFADVAPGSLEMDYDKLDGYINERTKAIIPVDVGGRMCDYDRIYDVVRSASARFRPANDLQALYGRPVVLADAAHSFGASAAGPPQRRCGRFYLLQLPRGEEPHHCRRRRRGLAGCAGIGQRLHLPRAYAFVPARAEQGRACQDKTWPVGVRHCLPRL